MATGLQRQRLGYCQKHASARISHVIAPDSKESQHLRTSMAVNCERTTTNTSNGSVHRYYVPQTAQFLSVDPLVGVTGQPYGYAGEDPANLSDPTGLCVKVWFVCVGDGRETSSISFRFDPGAAANAVVNIGRGASFGLSDKIANSIQPGASCTVPHNSIDEFIGGTASSIVAAEGAGRVVAGLRDALGADAVAPKPPGFDPATWTRMGASRASEPGLTWWDPQGAEPEWRWHPPDAYHPDPHWDYNRS